MPRKLLQKWGVPLIATLLVVSTFFAATPITQAAFVDSAHFVSSSSQYGSRAGNALFNIANNLTIEGWVKLSSDPGTDVEYTLLAVTSQYKFSYLNNGGTRQLYLALFTSGSNVNYLLNQTLSTGTWIHLAVAWEPSTHTATFYVNGSSVGSVTDASVTTIDGGGNPLNIGAYNGANRFMNGNVFLVRLWSSTRTQTQIANNYCTLLGATSNLIGEWSLDNVLTDDSGNALTLTNNNSFTFQADTPSQCVVVPPPPTSIVGLVRAGMM